MAITKAINKSTKAAGAMRNCIEYVLKEWKTADGLVDITGPYSYTNITYDNVYRAYMDEKKLWDKNSGRMYAHNVISFHENEKITPEQALEFGREFAEKVFGKFQTLISVHQDKNHLHIHFVTNSVSYMDGHKLHMKSTDLEAMKQITNNMCKKRGLSVAEKGKHFDGSSIEPGQLSAWSKDKYNQIKNDLKNSFIADCIGAIMEVIKKCCNKDEFIAAMHDKGWSVTWKDKRKNLTFENSKGEKVRDSNLSKTFNTDISKESLEAKFNENSNAKELENYYTKVEEEISMKPKGNGEERKSFREQLMESKKVLAERELRNKAVKKKTHNIEL